MNQKETSLAGTVLSEELGNSAPNSVFNIFLFKDFGAFYFESQIALLHPSNQGSLLRTTRRPGATKSGLSFSLFLSTMRDGTSESALRAKDESMSKSVAKAEKSCGLRSRYSSVAPLEIITGVWKLLAIATSLRRLEIKRILR
jgi:hypothetical protein